MPELNGMAYKLPFELIDKQANLICIRYVVEISDFAMQNDSGVRFMGGEIMVGRVKRSALFHERDNGRKHNFNASLKVSVQQ